MRSLWFIFFLTAFPLFAFCLGDDQYFIQHLDNRNGLSNSAVNCTFQDKDNILWIGTWDGLNRYDGSSFHVFSYGLNSIENNIIQYITEDRNNNIWISTIEGISRYNKSTGSFHNYFYTHSRKTPVSEQEFKIANDNIGSVICWAQPFGFAYFDLQADSFRILKFPQQPAYVAKMQFDAADNLWILDNKGVLQVFRQNERSLTLLRQYQSQDKIVNFFYVNNKLCYSTAGGQLLEINSQTLLDTKLIQLNHPIRAMGYYKGYYLLANTSRGLEVYDDRFRRSDFLQRQAAQMEDMKITCFTSGHDQLLWCGTDGNGVIKIYPKTKPFETIYTSGDAQLSNKAVRTFGEENNNLWVGTKGSGIIRYFNFWDEPASTLQKQYLTFPEVLDNNSVYVIKKGTDQLMYIGTDGKGIGLFDIRREKFLKWKEIKNNANCPEFGSVYAIVQDKDSSVWLGTSGFGLIHLKIYRNEEKELAVQFLGQYRYKGNDTGPANDIIYALVNGDDQTLWIACRYGGLSLMDKKNKSFRNYKAFTYESSLSHNDVLSLYRDSRKRLWVGTSYGLNQLDPADLTENQPTFRRLTTANGLPNNTIHAITEDNSGQIWVSTNKGLARIQPASFEISNYQEADGLQSNEFSDGAVWKNHNSYLFFGGTYGFNYFLPQQISSNTQSPNLLVSGLQLGDRISNENRFIVVHPDDNAPEAYSISRKGDFFELQVKAISYFNSEKCEYAYILEGFDKKWIYSGTSGKIVYSNISPGNYTLKVKWSNGEGAWTKEIPLFTLTVKQYFWLTQPALFLYFLILATIAYIIYSYRKNKQEMKHQLEIEHIMRKKEEELHQQQLVLFTNITHELQTPLTLIMGSIERSLESDRDVLSLIHQQASRLAYLVQQLLDFRKAEAGFLKNETEMMDISGLLTNLAGLFVPLCRQQQRRFRFGVEPAIHGLVDRDKLEKVMFNLLSNAVKHSGRQDEIELNVQENKGTLEITVSNTGARIEPAELDRLFDKFYVANLSAGPRFGAGLGLSFTRQLVSIMNGTITATCEDNRISFQVRLPLPDEYKLTTDKQEPQGSVRPSYLYQAMTTTSKVQEPLSVTTTNKLASIDSLQQEKEESILIVEDEAGIRYLLKDILKNQYTLYEAENGKDALELLANIHPHLIISDIMMPDMNGLELCNTVKNAPSTCHIPFLILSAKGDIEHQTEGYEVGADAYIAKPFHIQHLKVRVRKLLEYRKRVLELFQAGSLLDYNVESELIDADKKFLSSVIAVIEDHLDDTEFNAAGLEKCLNLSKMQLYRRLKTLSQMTPGEFIKNIRLKHAANLLSTTQLTVMEIFYRTGFNNQSYFYREFKKRYSCAPNEYRGK